MGGDYIEYPEIYMPQHHRAKICGCVDVHIVEAEKLIGRELKDEEVVHHKDGDKTNYSLDNLLVFINNENHVRYHHTGIYEETCEPFVVLAPKQYIDKCVVCGREIEKTQTSMCRRCYTKSTRKHKRPSREELTKLLKEHNIVSIGKMFGVSDNSIRKWCKSYEINYKDIRQTTR